MPAHHSVEAFELVLHRQIMNHLNSVLVNSELHAISVGLQLKIIRPNLLFHDLDVAALVMF